VTRLWMEGMRCAAGAGAGVGEQGCGAFAVSRGVVPCVAGRGCQAMAEGDALVKKLQEEMGASSAAMQAQLAEMQVGARRAGPALSCRHVEGAGDGSSGGSWVLVKLSSVWAAAAQ
jgi:hypothetical protein